MKKKFAFLQRFNEGGTGGTGGEGGAGGEGGTGGTGGAAGGEGGSGEGGNAGGGGNGSNPKPFAVFPDEASFMGRVSREAKKLQKDFLTSLGLENEDALKTIITSHNEQIEANKTELQKAQDAAKAATKAQADAIAKANKVLLNAEAKLQISAAGVAPEKVDRFMKLLDLSEVTVGDTGVDTATLKTLVDTTIAEFPEFKVVNKQGKSGGDFGEGGQGGQDLLTVEKIRTMSQKEIEARLPEVMKVLEAAGK